MTNKQSRYGRVIESIKIEARERANEMCTLIQCSRNTNTNMLKLIENKLCCEKNSHRSVNFNPGNSFH